ncbi:MAG: hypothetical protein IT305_22370 [Chloroflexi bacterium]|nr:hypothetical protein [Chloroflexota bacterium]
MTDQARNGGQDGAHVPGRDPGRDRLLAALDAAGPLHLVNPGALGEYAESVDRSGPEAAAAAFPDVAAHLAAGCDACAADLRELRSLVDMDRAPTPETGGAEAEAAGPNGRAAAARHSPTVWPNAAPSDAPEAPPGGTLHTQPIAPRGIAAFQRTARLHAWRERLLAVAAVVAVLFGGSLVWLAYQRADRGEAVQISLIGHETTTPLTPPAAAPAQTPPAVATSATEASVPASAALLTAEPTTLPAPGGVAPASASTTAAPSAPPASAPASSPAAAPAPPPTATAHPPTTTPAASPTAGESTAAGTAPGGAQPSPSPGARGAAGSAASVRPEAENCPADHPVKANRPSMIYHAPGGQFYARTRPEECFATPADAERAGYRRSQR